jgi:hypothetical protein
MEALYYISIRQQVNGSHIIHIEGCPLLPEQGKTIFLGIFDTPESAMKEGKDHFRKSDYCPFCLKEHHLKRKKPATIRLFAEMDLITSDRVVAPWESTMVCGVN